MNPSSSPDQRGQIEFDIPDLQPGDENNVASNTKFEKVRSRVEKAAENQEDTNPDGGNGDMHSVDLNDGEEGQADNENDIKGPTHLYNRDIKIDF